MSFWNSLGNLLFPFGSGGNNKTPYSTNSSGSSNVRSFSEENFTGLNPIWNDITGVTGQRQLADDERQWAEYMYNEYQSPAALVQQYEDAGLNPNLIGGQVGGNPQTVSTPSAGSPASAVGDIAGAATQIAQTSQNRKLNDANVENLKSSANLNNANAQEVSANAEALRRLQLSQRVKNYSDVGFTDLQAQGLAIDNKYRDENAKSDLLAKQLRIPQMIAEYAETLAQIDLSKQDLLNRKEELKLTQATTAKVDWERQNLEVEKELKELEKRERSVEVDFAEKHGFSYNSSTDILLLGAVTSGDEALANKICQSVSNQSFSSALGSKLADFKGKYSILEIPSVLIHEITDFVNNGDFNSLLDTIQKNDKVGNAIMDAIKLGFEIIQEDNVYNWSNEGNQPLYK